MSDARPSSVTPGTLVWQSCDLPADFEAVAPVVDRLCVWLRERGGAEDQVDSIRLAVTEAVTNAVEHRPDPACEGHAGRLEWAWRGEQVEIRISETGRYVPPVDWDQLPGDALSEGGRGGFLIRELMDSAEHINTAGCHMLVMRKTVGPAGAPPEVSELEQTLDAMTEELGSTYESLSALFSFSEMIAVASGLQEFLTEVFTRLSGLVAFDVALVRIRDDAAGGLRLFFARGVAPGSLAAVVTADRSTAEGRAFVDCQERTLESVAALDATDPLYSLGGCAFLCPLTFQSKEIGVLTVVRRTGAEAFFPNVQLSLMRTVADFIGIAQANADLQEQRRQQQRTVRELEIATQIQASLLPTEFPSRPDWMIHGMCRNATAVGGDFFDVLEIPGRGVLLVIADVMGKGVPAALLATIFRTALRARLDLATEHGPLLATVNAQLLRDLERLSMFITAQAAFLPAGGGPIEFASAGHGPVLLIDRTGVVQRTEGGLPLGVLADATYETYRAECPAGTSALFMTDGIHETVSPQGVELGSEGVAAIAARHCGETPARLCALVLEETARHAQGAPAADDRTLLAATRLT
ncbi:SpoIIE family protein phosphatase [Opitutaceae bacterium]